MEAQLEPLAALGNLCRSSACCREWRTGRAWACVEHLARDAGAHPPAARCRPSSPAPPQAVRARPPPAAASLARWRPGGGPTCGLEPGPRALETCPCAAWPVFVWEPGLRGPGREPVREGRESGACAAMPGAACFWDRCCAGAGTAARGSRARLVAMSSGSLRRHGDGGSTVAAMLSQGNHLGSPGGSPRALQRPRASVLGPLRAGAGAVRIEHMRLLGDGVPCRRVPPGGRPTAGGRVAGLGGGVDASSGHACVSGRHRQCCGRVGSLAQGRIGEPPPVPLGTGCPMVT